MVSEKMYALGAQPSAIRDLYEYGLRKAEEVGAENVFDFTLGNPSIPAPAEVNLSILKHIKEDPSIAVHGYTPGAGDPKCRQAIAKDLNTRFGTDYSLKDIFITCGAAPAVTASLAALCVDGEVNEIIVNAPFFPEYKVFANNCGAELIILPADEEGFQINFPALEAAISANTRAVMVNSPNNPCGVAYSEETVKKLANLLAKRSAELGHTIYIVCDEPYRELYFGEGTVPFIPNFYSSTIVCYSYSKSLSLPGERIGYVLVPPLAADSRNVWLAVAGAARSMGHVCAPSLMQKMVTDCAGIRPDIGVYKKNAAYLQKEMSRIGYQTAHPDGAFYFFFKAPHGLTAKEFSDLARDNYNVLLVPGGSFGCPDWLRLSFCCETEKLEKVMPYLEKLYKETEK